MKWTAIGTFCILSQRLSPRSYNELHLMQLPDFPPEELHDFYQGDILI